MLQNAFIKKSITFKMHFLKKVKMRQRVIDLTKEGKSPLDI